MRHSREDRHQSQSTKMSAGERGKSKQIQRNPQVLGLPKRGMGDRSSQGTALRTKKEGSTLVISFTSEKPRARLLEGKRVFTARRRRRKQFIDNAFGRGLWDWANEGRTKPKIADVIIFEYPQQVQAQDLQACLPWSGFEEMSEWVEEIKRLNRWKDVCAFDKFWLYLVQEKESFFKPWTPD